MLLYGENAPDAIVRACFVVINSVVYILGGSNYFSKRNTNALWTLYIKLDGYVAWNKLFTANAAKAPSPRFHHCAWEYSGKLWVFGGSGPSPNGHLNKYYSNGDFIDDWGSDVCYNRVLCFDPATQEWTNPKCIGSVPSPRRDHATVIIKEKVWLFGGWNRFATKAFDELYELNMHSLVWTQIQTADLKPRGRRCCTLNVISDDVLVLHGGAEKLSISDYKILNDTWILDLKRKKWRLYTSANDHCRVCHTGTTGLDGCVVIIGGAKDPSYKSSDYTTIFHVKLEPKSLQQVAMQTIFAHRTQLPWKDLPKMLREKLI